jgi:hypothetical protein
MLTKNTFYTKYRRNIGKVSVFLQHLMHEFGVGGHNAEAGFVFLSLLALCNGEHIIYCSFLIIPFSDISSEI